MLAERIGLHGGRYELQERIGSGGYSEVWRGHDRVLDRLVAVKVLDARYVSDEEVLARFRSEARNAGRLRHPNIARVYDFCEADPPEPSYLVMELVEGPSLAGVLADGPLEPFRAMDIVAQAAAGLHEAHVAGLVHRDIKPGNLLLGARGLVKVADFGISHAIGSAPVTSTGVVVGSPGYVAPERAFGASATPASDIYGLGVVAYECLAGRPPFTGTGLEVALAHINRPFPALPPSVPAEVAAFVGQLASKDPALRPADASVVAEQATRLATGLRDDVLGVGHGVTGTKPSSLGSDVGTTSAAMMRQYARLNGNRGASAGSIGIRRLAGRPRRGPWSQVPRRRQAMLAAVAGASAATACGALALMLALTLAAPSGPAAGASSSLANNSDRPSASVLNADVRSGQLVGLPVAVVARRLRELGLTPKVTWRRTRSQPPGTVVSVSPGGLRPAGSVITIIGARPDSRFRLEAPAGGSGPGRGHHPGGGGKRHGGHVDGWGHH